MPRPLIKLFLLLLFFVVFFCFVFVQEKWQMEKAATTFWRTLTNFKCGKWRFCPDIPRTLPLPYSTTLCSSNSSSLWHLAGWPACLLTGWRIVATTAQLNVGEAGEVLITKQQAASEACSTPSQGVRRIGGWTGSCSANGAAFQLRCEAWPAARLSNSSRRSSRSSCKARHEQSYCHSRKVKRPLDNNNSEKGESEGGVLLKQVKRWKPVAKAHGKSYLLRLGNPGQQLRLACSPAAAHEFKMRRSSGPKLCFQRFYLRKISSRNTPSLSLSQPVLRSLLVLPGFSLLLGHLRSQI